MLVPKCRIIWKYLKKKERGTKESHQDDDQEGNRRRNLKDVRGLSSNDCRVKFCTLKPLVKESLVQRVLKWLVARQFMSPVLSLFLSFFLF